MNLTRETWPAERRGSEGQRALAAAGGRLPMLDGLRGAAALAVVAYHFNLDRLTPLAIPHAYLAVDLFFMLSGFVVARAYEARLDAGAGLGWFLRVRLKRLYPIHLLGVVLGGAGSAALVLSFAPPGRLGSVLQAALMAALFLPALGRGNRPAFITNAPAWSLSLELIANLAYALATPWLTTRRLAVLTALNGLLLAVTTLWNGGIPGPHAHDFLLGLPRVGFGFGVGVGLHRLARAGRLRAPRVAPSALLAALGLILFAPVEDPWRAPFDAACVLLALPPLVACAILSAPGPRLARVFEALGRPSYALYALHTPVKALALLAIGLGASRAVGPLALFASIGLAILVARWLEPGRTPPRRATPPPVLAGAPG